LPGTDRSYAQPTRYYNYAMQPAIDPENGMPCDGSNSSQESEILSFLEERNIIGTSSDCLFRSGNELAEYNHHELLKEIPENFKECFLRHGIGKFLNIPALLIDMRNLCPQGYASQLQHINGFIAGDLVTCGKVPPQLQQYVDDHNRSLSLLRDYVRSQFLINDAANPNRQTSHSTYNVENVLGKDVCNPAYANQLKKLPVSIKSLSIMCLNNCILQSVYDNLSQGQQKQADELMESQYMAGFFNISPEILEAQAERLLNDPMIYAQQGKFKKLEEQLKKKIEETENVTKQLDILKNESQETQHKIDEFNRQTKQYNASRANYQSRQKCLGLDNEVLEEKNKRARQEVEDLNKEIAALERQLGIKK
jgi:hypothetical protein